MVDSYNFSCQFHREARSNKIRYIKITFRFYRNSTKIQSKNLFKGFLGRIAVKQKNSNLNYNSLNSNFFVISNSLTIRYDIYFEGFWERSNTESESYVFARSYSE
jgi:hypothetical protein